MGRSSFSPVIEEVVESCEEQGGTWSQTAWTGNLSPQSTNSMTWCKNYTQRIKHKGAFWVILREKPLSRNSLFHIFIFRIWIILVISLNVTMWKAVNTVLNTSKCSASGIYYHPSSNHIWKSNVVEWSQSENPVPVFFHGDNQDCLPNISGFLSSRHMVAVHFKAQGSDVGFVTSWDPIHKLFLGQTNELLSCSDDGLDSRQWLCS